jgi:hypothetical protein
VGEQPKTHIVASIVYGQNGLQGKATIALSIVQGFGLIIAIIITITFFTFLFAAIKMELNRR